MPVAENNPKFLNSILKVTKNYSKTNKNYNPYNIGSYSRQPDASQKCSAAKHQYINGHFCYAVKAGIVTNDLGIVKNLQVFNDDLKIKHPDIIQVKSNNPDIDKEVGDFVSLKPVLSDFFSLHPTPSYKTFIGDSAFDSHDTYSMLRDDFGFERSSISINLGNSKSNIEKDSTDIKMPKPVLFNENGIPLCPLDKTPFITLGKSTDKRHSLRYKFVGHKSEKLGTKLVCACEFPCTASTYGRCVYLYPDKDFTMYPSILRGTMHWDNFYRHQITVECTINLLKTIFAVSALITIKHKTLKADLYIAGITQLLCIVLAHAIYKTELYNSIRTLVS